MFKDIKGYEGKYQIDENGIVKSLPRKKGTIFSKEKILKKDINSSGYERVTLSKDNKTKKLFVHRLVFETFEKEIPEKMTIHHIDEDKRNNRIGNLMLATQKENNHYSREKKGYKLFERDVKEIRKSKLSTKELSEKFGVSPRQILKVKKNEQWKE